MVKPEADFNIIMDQQTQNNGNILLLKKHL